MNIEGEKMTCGKYMIFGWIILNIILQFINTLLTDLVNPLYIYSFFVNSEILVFFGRYRFYYFDFTDFLLGITLLYFFYHLGKFN